MFMLRHYGQDAEGRRTTVNYFSARASAGEGTASAEVGAASVRTVVTARGGGDSETRALRDDRLAGELAGFGGVTLDAQAEAAINAALEACAARAREAGVAIEAGGNAAADALEDDPAEPYVPVAPDGNWYRGALIPPSAVPEEAFVEGEPNWRHAGGDDPRVAIEAAVAEVKRARRGSNWGKRGKGTEAA